MNTINYRNITLARESRGMTQSGLSKEVKGLTQGNLSRIEKGLLSISDSLLAEISKVLDYPLCFFYKESQASSNGSLFYRKRVSMSQKQLSILEAKVDILNMVIDELMESVDVPELNIPHCDVSGSNTPSVIAFKLREYLGIQRGPLERIVNVLEKNGVIVIFLDIDNGKFDGVTKFTKKSQPVIFVNANMPNDRKRFTIGHELGHLVMHLRVPFDDVEDQEKERQANEFSAEFNLPFVECKRSLFNIRYGDLGNLKMYWKMSKAAILHRAREIGSLSDNSYKYYMMTLSKTGQRKEETEKVDIDQPVLLKKMIDAHLYDLDYSEEELSNLVGLSVADFQNLCTMLNRKNYRLKILL